jgi:hypothetical protein
MTITATALNDVDLGAVASLTQAISDAPERGATTWNASVTWQGALRSQARIRDLRIELEGDLDLHAFLGLREGHAGYEALRVSPCTWTPMPRPSSCSGCTRRSSAPRRWGTRCRRRSR